MTSLTTSRAVTSLSRSLQCANSSRSVICSITAARQSRFCGSRNTCRINDRYFSFQSSRHQDAPAAPSYPRKNATPTGTSPARTPTYAKRVLQTPLPPVQTTRNIEANPPQEPIREISSVGLDDLPVTTSVPAVSDLEQVDWTKSFHGLSSQPFSKEAQEILMQPIDVNDIEIKPDGILYLPEIKYRRIMNRAFGPGGWGLAPRGETIVTAKAVTREYALLASGRLVSIARGEQDYFDSDGIPTATEGCKSNALMRCCKDLGVASELWDPRFIRGYLKQHAKEIWVEHQVTKKKKKMTMRKDDEVRYPFKEVKSTGLGI